MDRVTRALIRIEEARQIARQLEQAEFIGVVQLKPPVILKDGATLVTEWEITPKEEV